MSYERKAILYVDADPASCSAVTRWISLNDDSFDVTACASVEEARAAMRASSYDLFLFDYCLISGTGAELCRELRALGCSKSVIIFSAIGRQIDRDTATSAGVTEYLVKPEDFDVLIPTIRRALGITPRFAGNRLLPSARKAVV